MRKERMNNKGFSLVELIIVIAIMAILIGIMAPNLMRFIERANVSADTQIADTLRMALITAIADPMTNDNSGNKNAFITAATGTTITLTDGLTQYSNAAAFKADVEQTLGDKNIANLLGELKSTRGTAAFLIRIDGGNVIVTIQNTDRTGSRAFTNQANWITVGSETALTP